MTIDLEWLKETVPDPLYIVKELDKYVIGQDEAKKILSIVVLNRALIKLTRHKKIVIDVDLNPFNTLIIGPSGSGKTELIRSLEKIVDIPIGIYDITSITSGAYIGNKVEDILVSYVNKCYEYVTSNYSRIMESAVYCSEDMYLFTKQDLFLEEIETGIIYIDEIDKIRKDFKTSYKDISGECVQYELLKLLERGNVSLAPARADYPLGSISKLNTKDVTFLCGGAFSGIADIIKTRLNRSSGIGFTSAIRKIDKVEYTNYLQHLTTEDLKEYGFVDEFLGRVSLRAILNPLTVETMIKIIEMPENSIFSRYKEMFRIFGISLEIDSGAVQKMAEIAVELQMGARALNSLFTGVMSEFLLNIFNIPDNKIVITKEMIK